MSRLTLGIALAASLASTYARAQTQAEIAARENDEGKQLMFADPPKYAEASAKFQDAVARVPEAKYFFNLCTSRYQEGKFGEALTACNAVEKNGASDELKGKTLKLVDRIKDEAKAQGIDLQPAGGGAAPGEFPPPPPDNGGTTPPPDSNGGTTPPPPNGGTGQPPTQPAYAVGRPPTAGLYQAAKPEHHYMWTLGIDLFGGGGKIGGQVGGMDAYGHSAGGFRIKSDYLLDPRRKLGLEGYIQITHFNAGPMQDPSVVSSLDVFDIGVAGYKHLCMRGVQRLCLTPLVGVQLALESPANQTDGEGSQVFNYTALGLRAQLSADFAFGTHYQNVLSAMFGVNAYTAVLVSPSADSGSAPADQIGLDTGGAYAYIGVGYTYRFDTPFGQAPFVTLE
ncbi:MAG TPA: proline-rich domain-containing protein [Kofleriaceae bacterium]|nr:proline-rich domain-containing protein [Kofleriaceae bacterium]